MGIKRFQKLSCNGSDKQLKINIQPNLLENKIKNIGN